MTKFTFDSFVGRPGKREVFVCVYVAGQRKVWCAKRFAPLSPTPRSPKFPALPPPFSGFFSKRQQL